MNGETNVEQIQIIDSNKHVGETVKIGAWIANKRSSGKKLPFYNYVTGTAFFSKVSCSNQTSLKPLVKKLVQKKIPRN